MEAAISGYIAPLVRCNIKYQHNFCTFCFRRKRFQVVDIQNATLSGGVAVGALADLMIQPGGAFVMGTICGIVSALGYRLFQVNI